MLECELRRSVSALLVKPALMAMVEVFQLQVAVGYHLLVVTFGSIQQKQAVQVERFPSSLEVRIQAVVAASNFVVELVTQGADMSPSSLETVQKALGMRK